ncbi:MAG: methylated-DNA--[protein]-cysteine S-methyltransferase [Pseudorhodoplanes sp.]|uniref:methylated-DNA--[protein]-cysteine S-methyltransferase n=1 Tax=Pseudorhodoplanes sp. TaxID=1934341 RepID=UPI003D100543
MAHDAPNYLSFHTAMGFCGIAWNDVGIVCFRLPAASAAAADRLILRRHPQAAPGLPPAPVADAVAAATRYFEGQETDFSDCALDLGAQKPFFARVYDTVRALKWGQTTTYGAVAKDLGAGPEAARDVGQAMATNPVPLIIPCHRVLAAGGKVGGFSAPGGSAAKARMLALEGVRTQPLPPAQQAFGF